MADIGDNETPGSAGPVDLGSGRSAITVTAKGFTTCALLDDGTLRCWGGNYDGELGYGNFDTIGDDETPGSVGPVALGGLIDVEGAPDAPPTAAADSETVSEDSAPTAIDVLANDSDPDGGPMSVDSVTQPLYGDVQITGGGSGLTYQPGPEYCNDPDPEPTDDFTYTLNGGSTATVSMTVSCVDDLFTLTVRKLGSGTGTVSSSPAGIDCGLTCSDEYVEGTEVELSAAAAPGSTFAGFSGANCQYQLTCTVEISRARNVDATFRVNYVLAVTRHGTGTGTVSSSPAGIECGATCSHEYVTGTAVELSATAAPGSTFVGFSGADCQYQLTCTVKMSRVRSVDATFRINHTLTVTKRGTGTGTVSSSPAGIECGATCSHEYVKGTAVELSATADPGSTFAGFSGANCQSQLTCTVKMSRVRTVEATFSPAPDTDLDGDGVPNAIDTCTDVDADGYGRAGFDRSGCARGFAADPDDNDLFNPG